MGHKPTCRGLTSRQPRVTNRNEARYDVQPRTDGLARKGWFRMELEPCEWKLSCTVLRGKGFVRIWTTRWWSCMARAPRSPEKLGYLDPVRKGLAALPLEELNEDMDTAPFEKALRERTKG